MPLGGRRPGAGRPKGSKNKPRSHMEKIMKATFSGATPIDVMLGTMRAYWAAAQDGDSLNMEMAEAAHDIAKDVAPYVHPRLQAIEYVPPPDMKPQQDTDLIVLARKLAFLVRLGERHEKQIEGQVIEGPKAKP